MAITVFAPLAYIIFLFGSLYSFSKIYRRRKASAQPEPWFPPHHTRDLYVSLLSLPTPPSDQVLIAALLRRAMVDVTRIWAIRDGKQALTSMLQKGQIGDELWERFQDAEKELEAEIVEVVEEANTYKAGWGQQIFGIASEMVQHEKVKDVWRGLGKERESIAAQQAASTHSSSSSASASEAPRIAPPPTQAPVASTSTAPPPAPAPAPATNGTSATIADADDDDDEDGPAEAGTETKTTPGKKKKKSKGKKK